ncbi:MAG: hypothetical protein KC468_11215 [Myxococcales bacterium]|nr:hypothetical protein [Myxococcales bacterium]
MKRTTISPVATALILPALSGMLLASGCVGPDDDGDESETAGEPEGEGDLDDGREGVYRYVLGFDGEDQTLGGAHWVRRLTDDRGKAEAIDDANRANRLHPELGQDVHQKWDPTLKSGETDWDVFASNWWPQSKNGTAWRWQPGAPQDYSDLSDRDRLSPLEKYDLVFNPGQPQQVAAITHCRYPDYVANPQGCQKIDRPAVSVAGPATKWELEHQGVYQQFEPDSWWGHCNGWASYVTAEPLGAPLRDIRVKLDGDKVTECADASDPACMLFRMGDIEALMTELYFSDQATFTGRRCNASPDDIATDEYGRPTDVRCRDLNPGSFHIALVGLLGRGAKHLATGEQGARPAFVIDHNYDWEVWNFPVVKYEIKTWEEIDRKAANELVGAAGSSYAFNDQATRFIRVRLDYWMVSDGVSVNEMLKQASARAVAPHQVELNYVLELDDAGTILGGEWTEGVPEFAWSDGVDSKTLHPDFAWMAVDPQGWGEGADDEGGDDDNPHLRYSHVKALLECANNPDTCGGEAGPTTNGPSCVDQCGAGPFSADGVTCYCDSECTKYGDCCEDYKPVCGAPEEPEPEPEPEPQGPTCSGHCGADTPVPDSDPACYCDDQCANYGDCCDDKVAVCGE